MKYDKCNMYFKDGTLGCLISTIKMNWYIKKGLAEVIDDKSIKLLFDVKGDKNYMRDRDNICVICSSKDKLYGYNVINPSFKRYFPLEHKNHNNELVFLVCRECQPDTDYYNGLYIKAIFDEYKETPDDQPLYDKNIINIYNIIKKYKSTNIEYYNDEDKEIIKKHFGHIPESKELAHIKSDYAKYLRKYGDCENLYEYIIKKVVDSNKIKEFEDGFLKHFLKYLEPQFIPDDVLERVKPLLEELEHEMD